MNFENIENIENIENDNKIIDVNLALFSEGVSFYFNCFILISFFYNISIIFHFLYDNEHFHHIYIYLNNNLFVFITNFQNELSKKLLKYNGLISDSESSSDSDSDTSSDTALVKPEVKYEDKYLDDIKQMSLDYVLSWSDIELKNKKLSELFESYNIFLINEKYILKQEIIEKEIRYLEMDEEEGEGEDDYEICDIKKEYEEEIILLRAKVKILEEITENEILNKFKLEARDFVIKERLDKLKNNFIIEKTPLGNVIMFWDNFRGSFVYYSDNTIPYRYLETVSRKYVKTFNCRQIYFDMEFELFEFERKQKDRQESDMKLLEDKKKMELEQNTSFNSNLGLVEKKNVFAKFKNYNKESGTGRVNRGVAPPKNSIPNNNNMKNTDENVVLKENANRYTYEGRLSNFSFLKKTDRKVIDKKYAMSFADFKKNMLHK